MFHSVEFYVICAVIAAAAVALAALPRRRDAAVLHMAAGELSGSDEGRGAAPALEIEVDDNYRVHIRRTGLPEITDAGAASLAITVAGFDVAVEERLVYGRGWPTVDTARFTLDFFGRERYHVRYNSEDTGLFTAFTLPVKPGIRIRKELKN